MVNAPVHFLTLPHRPPRWTCLQVLQFLCIEQQRVRRILHVYIFQETRKGMDDIVPVHQCHGQMRSQGNRTQELLPPTPEVSVHVTQRLEKSRVRSLTILECEWCRRWS